MYNYLYQPVLILIISMRCIIYLLLDSAVLALDRW